MRPFVLGLFFVAATLGGAIPGVAVGALWRAFDGAILSRRVGGWLVMVSLFLDLLNRRGVRVTRPLAVFRQVPRSWGHRVGPWWAALRYGFRMGFGPATILVSWSWWVGFVLVASAGPISCAIGALVFAGTRTITMALATGDVAGGTAMARRAARLDVLAGIAAKVLMIVTFAVGLVGAAS